MHLNELVSRLREAYGDDLVAVALYGSAAVEPQEKARNQNVLVLVKALAVEALVREAPVARAWAKSGNPPPLTLTEHEWAQSADIFPMEYADILERHKVLHGALPVSEMAVDREHLRLQLEQEVMGKLIKLRQGVLASGGKPRAMLELLEDSLSTFLVLFRSTVRLHGETPPADREALVERTAALTGLDAAPFLRVVRHVRGGARLTEGDAPALIDRYLAETGSLRHHLDALERTP